MYSTPFTDLDICIRMIRLQKLHQMTLTYFLNVKKLFLSICLHLYSPVVDLYLFNLCSISYKQLGFIALHVKKIPLSKTKQSYYLKMEITYVTFSSQWK